MKQKIDTINQMIADLEEQRDQIDVEKKSVLFSDENAQYSAITGAIRALENVRAALIQAQMYGAA